MTSFELLPYAAELTYMAVRTSTHGPRNKINFYLWRSKKM